MDRISILRKQFVWSEAAILLCLRRQRKIARFIIASSRENIDIPTRVLDLIDQDGLCSPVWWRIFTRWCAKIARNFARSLAVAHRARSRSTDDRVAAITKSQNRWVLHPHRAEFESSPHPNSGRSAPPLCRLIHFGAQIAADATRPACSMSRFFDGG